MRNAFHQGMKNITGYGFYKNPTTAGR